jgi:Dehydrogenases with different specificities (related to short-chain alcohol dehydrogenases)
MDINLKDKKIILTGGSRGIGLSILEKLYSLGSQILIIGSNKENLQKTKSKYPKILIEAFDLGDHNQITNLFKNCMHQIGGLDVLINNAGITRDNLAIRMSKDEWSKVIDVNLTSSFLMSQEAIKLMLKNKKGSIINITSVVAHLGNAGQVNYASSKAALIAMSKSLAREYAKKNIRVNCISPGFIDTDMTSVLKEDQKAILLNNIPMGKMGVGNDIANGVIFLASDMSSYITGETIHINGGMYMA